MFEWKGNSQVLNWFLNFINIILEPVVKEFETINGFSTSFGYKN